MDPRMDSGGGFMMAGMSMCEATLFPVDVEE